MTEPMAAEIAAHERAVGKLLAELERAKREWHRLARAADDAMRDTRPRNAPSGRTPKAPT